VLEVRVGSEAARLKKNVKKNAESRKKKSATSRAFAVPSESPFDRTSRVLTPRVSAAAAASEAGGNEA